MIMGIIKALQDNKKSIILIAILIGLVGIVYTLFTPKPREIIVTKTVTVEVVKYVDRVVNVKADTIEDTITTVVAPDGTKTTIEKKLVDKSITDSKTIEQITSKSSETDKTVTKYAPNYTIGIYTPYKVNLTQIPKLEDIHAMLGVRIFSLPVFATFGTTMMLSEFTIGLTLEL